MWQRGGWMAVLACWTILVPGPSSGHIYTEGIDDSLKMSGKNVTAGTQNFRQKSVMLRKLRSNSSGSNWMGSGEDVESSESTHSNLGIKNVESFKGQRSESQHFLFHGRESVGSVGQRVNTTNGRTFMENSEPRSRRKGFSGGDSRRTRNMTRRGKNGGDFSDELQTFFTKTRSVGKKIDDPSGSTRVALKGEEVNATMAYERPKTISDSRVEVLNDEESGKITLRSHESSSHQNVSTTSEKAKVRAKCDFETNEHPFCNTSSSTGTLFNASVEVATAKIEIHGLETSYNETRGPRVSAVSSMDNKVVPEAGNLARSLENLSDKFAMKHDSRKSVRESTKNIEHKASARSSVDKDKRVAIRGSENAAINPDDPCRDEKESGGKLTRIMECSARFDGFTRGGSNPPFSDGSASPVNDSISGKHRPNVNQELPEPRNDFEHVKRPKSSLKNEKTSTIESPETMIDNNEMKSETREKNAIIETKKLENADKTERLSWQSPEVKDLIRVESDKNLVTSMKKVTTTGNSRNRYEISSFLRIIDNIEDSFETNSSVDSTTDVAARTTLLPSDRSQKDEFPSSRDLFARNSSLRKALEMNHRQNDQYAGDFLADLENESNVVATVRRKFDDMSGKSNDFDDRNVGAIFSTIREEFGGYADRRNDSTESIDAASFASTYPTIAKESETRTLRNGDSSKVIDSRVKVAEVVVPFCTEETVSGDEGCVDPDVQNEKYAEALARSHYDVTRLGEQTLDKIQNSGIGKKTKKPEEDTSVGATEIQRKRFMRQEEQPNDRYHYVAKEIPRNSRSYSRETKTEQEKDALDGVYKLTVNKSDGFPEEKRPGKKSSEIDERPESEIASSRRTDQSQISADTRIRGENRSEVGLARAHVKNIAVESGDASSFGVSNDEHSSGVSPLLARITRMYPVIAPKLRTNFSVEPSSDAGNIAEPSNYPLALTDIVKDVAGRPDAKDIKVSVTDNTRVDMKHETNHTKKLDVAMRLSKLSRKSASDLSQPEARDELTNGVDEATLFQGYEATLDYKTMPSPETVPVEATSSHNFTPWLVDRYILSKGKRIVKDTGFESSSSRTAEVSGLTEMYTTANASDSSATSYRTLTDVELSSRTSIDSEQIETPDTNLASFSDTAIKSTIGIVSSQMQHQTRVSHVESLDSISEFPHQKLSSFVTVLTTTTTTTTTTIPNFDDKPMEINVRPVVNWNTTMDPDDTSNRTPTTSNQWPVKHSAVIEGDLVLGGLMMVHEREDSVICGPVMPQGGVQALESMLYTLDRLNNQQIIPGVKIGAHILDDCDKDTYGLEMAVDFIKGSISNIDGAEYHCNKTAVRKVISGVVGAASSVTSIQVANLLRLFRIPQVSFFSTSPELSNKQRFEYFSRTIPSDHYQVKAMVDIVRKMNWSYVSIIYEESNYGIKAFEELEELLAKYDICIAIKEKLVKDSGVAKETAYDNIVQKLLTKPRAKGCIIFGSDQEVAGVMRAVSRCNATGAFSWIGSDGWSARDLVSNGNEAEVEGTLSVQPQANPVQGFEKYFLNLTVENNRRNPWFVEFWEDHFQCRYPNSSMTPHNQNYTNLCTTRERLTKQNTAFEDQLQFVSDAVMAFAHAFRDMHKELCKGKPGLCDSMKPTKGTELLKYLRKVEFQGLSGDRFKFDKNGDGPARYNIIHFKQVAPKVYRWVRVGEYLEGELRLNMSEIQFRLGNPSPPESVCSLPCEVGQAKKYVEGESCCWHCFECTQYQVRHPDDETQCFPCPQGTVPDETHSNCRDIPEEYLRLESGWAIGAMSFSATGILITLFVGGVFLRHNDTPVVRASGRELSYVLLTGILLCYLVTFALVLRPNDIVCGIQRFGAGFCFTVVYAALLTKTNRISRIFNAGKQSAKRPSLISPRSQLIICSGMVGGQILINGVWMVIDPAKAMHYYPTREDNLLVCSSYINASYMIVFSYPIILIVVCTVYAVLTRKIPEAFNESKHIGFTMYTTCVIWLAFVPLYFGTGSNVALRITSMSVTISLSASVTIACLFGPKLYIILIRPERNVRQSMMPRFNTTKSSAVTGTNASSMMAPVALTAATCNQNRAVQRHVKATIDCSTQSEHYEMELIDGRVNGKAPPSRIERSTQTLVQWLDPQESSNPSPTAAATNVAGITAIKEVNNKEKFTKDSCSLPAKKMNNVRIGNGPVVHKDAAL